MISEWIYYYFSEAVRKDFAIAIIILLRLVTDTDIDEILTPCDSISRHSSFFLSFIVSLDHAPVNNIFFIFSEFAIFHDFLSLQ